jgi:hypothetical protein
MRRSYREAQQETDSRRMKTLAEIDAALKGWWMHDGISARVSNTYLRHGESHAQAAEACFDDYEAGAHDALTAAQSGKKPVLNQLVQRYEKRMHGERIDVYSYRLGVQRVLEECGLRF